MTEYVFDCDQCGKPCGLICRACAVCPEPAGYWAWDETTMLAYLDALDDAAASESDPGIAQTLRSHRAVMAESWDIADAFSMDALASKLSERGIPSHVDMTGGGVATLYGGEILGKDSDEGDRYTLCIGPGTYGYGVHASRGSWAELAIGADDDGVTCVYWDGPRDLDAVVAWVVDHMPEYRLAVAHFLAQSGGVS